jgi:protein CpxP
MMVQFLKQTTRAIAAAALIGAMTLPFPASAQTPPPSQDPLLNNQSSATAPAAQNAPRKAARKQTRVDPVDRVEARITDLHAKLRITPAQEAQWSTVAQVMRENARSLDTILKQRATGGNMNALEDLHSYRDMSATHVQNVDKLLPAFEALYNTMSPEQKKNADTVFDQVQRPRSPNRKS